MEFVASQPGSTPALLLINSEISNKVLNASLTQFAHLERRDYNITHLIGCYEEKMS